MMKIKKVNLIVLAVSLLWCSAACNQRQELVDTQSSENEISIRPAVHQSAVTKTNYTEFEEGDKVGVFVVQWNGVSAPAFSNATSNLVNNNMYTCTSGSLRAYPADKYPKENKVDIYAYGPYTESVTSVSNHSTAVNANQSTLESLKASDLLWAKNTSATQDSGIAPSANAVDMIFKHMYSKVTIELTVPELNSLGMQVTGIHSPRFSNIKRSVLFNMSQGIANVTGSGSEVIPFELQNGAPGGKTYIYTAIVPSQEISNLDAFFTFDVIRKDEESKSAILRASSQMFGEHERTMQPGYSYYIKVQLADAWEVVLGSTQVIEDWDKHAGQVGAPDPQVTQNFKLTPTGVTMTQLSGITKLVANTDQGTVYDMAVDLTADRVLFNYIGNSFPSNGGYRFNWLRLYRGDVLVAQTQSYESPRVYTHDVMDLGEVEFSLTPQ